ncbi:hypothetical protein [Spirosoma telluris]|uniref:hypothetical protein n=1 Tax=Spirosoma telluris TaxID=2183553 RepID=UPI002FC3D5C9
MKISAQKYDAAANSNDAIPAQTMANDRLAKSLEYEESSARLELYKKRMDDYAAKTNEYGPLGSQLRQLNRALAVAEKEYLDLIQNVDQSRTRRQDVSIGGHWKCWMRPISHYYRYPPNVGNSLQLVLA